MKLFTRAERAFIETLYTLLQDKHINEIYVTDILKLSGYTKGAFYGRFENKYDFAKKMIATARKMHNYFLDRCGNIMWRVKDVSHPDSMKNSEDFFRFVYEYHKLYDIIIDRKIHPHSLELFLFGCEQFTFDSQKGTLTDTLVDDITNAFFGFYNSVIYIMLWRSMGYENISPEQMAQIILPVQSTVHKHYLDNNIPYKVYNFGENVN